MKKLLAVVVLILIGLGVQAGMAAFYANVAKNVANSGSTPSMSGIQTDNRFQPRGGALGGVDPAGRSGQSDQK